MNTNFAQRQPTRPSAFASPQPTPSSSFAPRPFATPTPQGGAAAPSQEPYEREAERVAGQVMRSARAGDGAASPPAALAGTSVPKPAVSYSGSGGRALPEPIRHRLGQSLGADLGSVRVHTDARADRLNRSLDSNAATVGGNIFFRHGEYQPESRAGQELIAHEAVHTVHQGAVEQSGGGDAGATIGLCQSPLCGPQRSAQPRRKYTSEMTGKVVSSSTKRNEMAEHGDSMMVDTGYSREAVQTCPYCFGAMTHGGSTVDHIVTPEQWQQDLSTGGPRDDQYNHDSNQIAVHASCNSSKGTTDLFDWWRNSGKVDPAIHEQLVPILDNIHSRTSKTRMTHFPFGEWRNTVEHIGRTAMERARAQRAHASGGSSADV